MEPGVTQRVLKGMGGGAVATGAMSAVMLAAQEAGLMGKLPPKKITETMLDWLHVRRTESEENVWTGVAHVAYGVGCGGLFAWLQDRVPAPVSAPVKGALFGSFVWLVSYFGWIPALGIMASPPRDRPGRPTSMLVAHVVFGTVLGLFMRRKAQPA
jgi:hypothetical protein